MHAFVGKKKCWDPEELIAFSEKNVKTGTLSWYKPEQTNLLFTRELDHESF